MRKPAREETASGAPTVDNWIPANPLLEFASESGPPPAVAAPAPARKRRSVVYVVLGLLAAAGVGVPGYWAGWIGTAATGSLQVESDPAGADVLIDGTVRGKTPASFTLPPGQHDLAVRMGDQTKSFTVSVADGVQTVHHVSWADVAGSAAADPASPVTGGIEITADAPGARVSVDGVDRGTAPVRLQDLAPGAHEVVVRAGELVHRRTVQVRENAVVSLVIGNSAPVQSSGWVVVSAPLPLQIYEGGLLVGTSEAARIMLPTGDHTLEVAAPALGFRSSYNVRITSGQTTKLNVQPPRVPLSINAIPWAEVWVDGEHVGQTPIANVSQTVGVHQVQFRHPQFGEKRVTVTVSLNEPARVSVDMRTP